MISLLFVKPSRRGERPPYPEGACIDVAHRAVRGPEVRVVTDAEGHGARSTVSTGQPSPARGVPRSDVPGLILPTARSHHAAVVTDGHIGRSERDCDRVADVQARRQVEDDQVAAGGRTAGAGRHEQLHGARSVRAHPQHTRQLLVGERTAERARGLSRVRVHQLDRGAHGQQHAVLIGHGGHRRVGRPASRRRPGGCIGSRGSLVPTRGPLAMPTAPGRPVPRAKPAPRASPPRHDRS